MLVQRRSATMGAMALTFASPPLRRRRAAIVACVLLAGLGTVVALRPSPARAAARDACPNKSNERSYTLTRAGARAIKRSFARRHHGYKIVGRLRQSILAPQGYVGLYWVVPGGPNGSDKSGGIAYYCRGRAVPNPSAAAISGLSADGLFAVVSSGTGTYTNVDTSTDPNAGTTTDTGTWTFNWQNTWGTARKPIDLNPGNTEGDGRGSPLSRSVSGSAIFQHADSLDSTQNFTCNVGVTRDSQANMHLEWQAVKTGRNKFGPGLQYAEELDPGTIVSDELPGPTANPNPECDVRPPSEMPDVIFTAPVLKPGKVGLGGVVWKSFSGSPTLHQHNQTGGTDPDSGLTGSEVTDLSVSETTRFLLVGIRPAA
jgi:hypothetical protein